MWKFPWSNGARVFPTQASRVRVDGRRFESSKPDDSPHLVVAQDPDPLDLKLIQDSVLNYNLQQAGPHGYRKLAVFLREPNGRVLGGITGTTYWGWLVIDFLWVPKELRGRGYGRQLLATAEKHARDRDCHHACLDTFTFQAAAGFYENFGYVRLGSLPDFPFGHERVYFYKMLAE